MVSVRQIDRFLEQWQMDARDLHRRLILAPAPRERSDGTPSGCWLKAGQLRVRRKPWDGILTPLDDGPPPLARVDGDFICWKSIFLVVGGEKREITVDTLPEEQ